MDEFYKLFAEAVVVGGGSAAIALGLIRWLGQKWIEQKFSIQLEHIKGDQQRDLEKLRQVLAGRVGRIYEKEFEILPKAWFLMHDAHGSACHAVGGFMKFYPDFLNMPEDQFAEFLTVWPGSRLSAYQKDALRKAQDKNKYFMNAMNGIDLDEAREKQRIFQNYLIEHRLFMPVELRNKFGAVNDDLANGVREYGFGKSWGKFDMQDSGVAKVMGLQAKIDEVEQAVRERLKYDEA